MKKIKILAFLITLILVLNILIPMVALANENINDNTTDKEITNNITDNTEQKENVTNNDVNNTQGSNTTEETTNNIFEKNENTIQNETEDNIIEDLEEKEDNTEETNQTEKVITEDKEIQEENKVIENKSTDIEAEQVSNVEFNAGIEINGYKINTYLKNGIYYLFLPNAIDITNVNINYTYGVDIANISSGSVDLQNKIITNDFSVSDQLTITFTDNKQYTIKVMQSDIPSICINLDDATLEEVNGGSKDEKYPARLQVVGASNAEYNITNKEIELKGRGNSTWNYDKKPYQIKFDKKENLLGLSGKSKKWILLANHIDRTLVKNALMCDLQKEIGSNANIRGQFVDLYINGEFLGNYYVCDKVDIGEARVNLENPKGLLCEMDAAYGWKEEYKFTSKISGMTFVVKESVSDEGTQEHTQAIKEFENAINQFESLIYAENPNWNEISKVIDIESFLKYYFLIEFAEDPDRFISSTYVYKDGPNDVLHIGPLWDNDTALGYHNYTAAGSNPSVDYSLNIEKYRFSKTNWYTQLYRNKQFVKLLNEEYENNVKSVFNTATTKIDNYIENMKKSIDMNFVRWDVIGTTGELPTSHTPKATYEGEIDYLKNWVSQRVAYMNTRYNTTDSLQYTTYIQNEGWEDTWKKQNQTSGTVGKGLAVQSIKITLPNATENQHIKYRVHVQDYGWMDWKGDGNTAGITGLRTEAIQIKLEGMDEYSVTYRVHVQDIGWTNWVKNGETAGTEGQGKRIEAIEILIEKTRYLGTTSGVQNSNINYTAHIQDIGWSGTAKDGETLGTMQESKRIEAIKIDLGTNLENIDLSYRVHVQDIGWQGWKSNGEIAGTTGQSKRIEAIEINVPTNSEYVVDYRVYVQGIGWQEWKSNGQMAGTTDQSRRIEAIEIKLQKKNYLGSKTPSETAKVLYSGHIQDIGWSYKGVDGETIGTVDRSKRIEALKIELQNIENNEISYRVHVQDVGWQDWKSNGEIAGTTGEEKRVEAIRIELKDTTKYDVQYRAYVQDIGWQDWKSNGEIAGTTGESKRIEAIQIKLVEK